MKSVIEHKLFAICVIVLFLFISCLSKKDIVGIYSSGTGRVANGHIILIDPYSNKFTEVAKMRGSTDANYFSRGTIKRRWNTLILNTPDLNNSRFYSIKESYLKGQKDKQVILHLPYCDTTTVYELAYFDEKICRCAALFYIDNNGDSLIYFSFKDIYRRGREMVDTFHVNEKYKMKEINLRINTLRYKSYKIKNRRSNLFHVYVNGYDKLDSSRNFGNTVIENQKYTIRKNKVEIPNYKGLYYDKNYPLRDSTSVINKFLTPIKGIIEFP